MSQSPPNLRRDSDAPAGPDPPPAPGHTSHPAPQPASQPEPDDPANQQDEELVDQGNRFLFFQVMPSWTSSFVIHVAIILALALVPLIMQREDTLSLASGEPTPATEISDQMSMDALEFSDDPLDNTELDETFDEEMVESFELAEEVPDFADSFDFNESPTEAIAPGVVTGGFAEAGGGATAGRGGATKQAMLRERGGTAGSENAVKLALEWIAKHQLEDGSWNFNHKSGPGERRSPNPGQATPAIYGATAIALLPFLGAGHTHLSGEYTDVVARGLEYLKGQGEVYRVGRSYSENAGTMYSHALVTLVLTEAYAMTRDSSLIQPAQEALNYIVEAQDPTSGGWRYNFRELGDTSVTGWQLMALKSGHMAGLDVPGATFKNAEKFLDSVASESNALYGYLEPASPDRPRHGMTAVGLLCRMYLGWSQENPSLASGIDYLDRWGPKIGDWVRGEKVEERKKTLFRCDMYYNYYATQVMIHYGGPTWKKWNQLMRDFLIESQARRGPALGSWYFSNPDDLGTKYGGRLYCTAMAAMTLEVYYRHMPLYNPETVREAREFILD